MLTEFLRTPRLLFRPFAEEDLDDLASISGDPEVIRFVGDGLPLDRGAVALWIVRSRENVARHGYGTGAVVELASGRLVGWAGWARAPDAPEELVYGFARDAWGQGYGAEIATGLVRFGRDVLKLGELRAITYEDNTASRRILVRAGFTAHPPRNGEVLHTLALTTRAKSLPR